MIIKHFTNHLINCSYDVGLRPIKHHDVRGFFHTAFVGIPTTTIVVKLMPRSKSLDDTILDNFEEVSGGRAKGMRFTRKSDLVG